MVSLTILTAFGAEARSIRVILDQGPATLNPRHTLDAPGQRLGVLLFSALTHIDENLEPKPDLASSWKVLPGGKKWIFQIRKDAKDHAGQPITAQDIKDCFEQYVHGKPKSAVGARFEHIENIQINKNSLELSLSRPDPYLARDITLIRFFRTSSKIACEEVSSAAFIGSGRYRLKDSVFQFHNEIKLIPIDPKSIEINFEVVRDDNTRALKMIREDADAAQNAVQFTKTRWLEKKYSDHFQFFERDSTTVSYLAFNLKDPILKNLNVRKAISLSIDRQKFVSDKMMGFGSVAKSLLQQSLAEATQTEFEYNPALAEMLLEEAGFKKDKNGVRLKLEFKTTPAREGYETALIFREMLGKAGIELNIEVVEPAVFLNWTRKGKFQLYQSRWVGVGDASILYRTLHSGENLNRTGYHNTEADKILEEAMSAVDLSRRKELYGKVQKKIFEDLPYFPLWFWKTSLVVNRKRHFDFEAHKLSLSGALDVLTQIR